MNRAAVGINQKVSSPASDCPLLYIINHPYICIIHQLHYFTEESSHAFDHSSHWYIGHICIWLIHHTSDHSEHPYIMQHKHPQIRQDFRTPKSRCYIPRWWSVQLYTTTTLPNDGMVTCKAHNIHCLHPQISRPTKSTHYVPELTQSTDWMGVPGYALHISSSSIFYQFLSEFAFRLIEVQVV